ncbi:MAG: hypothetical protein SGBAC_011631 [Bacillariaceae sp.]
MHVELRIFEEVKSIGDTTYLNQQADHLFSPTFRYKMSDHQELNESFQYDEQVLVETSGDVTVLRLEASSQWNPSTKFHPFAHLSKLFEVVDKVIGVSGLSNMEARPFLEMTMQVSSSASQDLPSSKKRLGLVTTMDGSLPTGPSGFFLQIRSSLPPSPSLITKIEALVQSWMDLRLVTAPLSRAPWDVIVESSQEENDSQTSTVVQVFLPANGAAWSADALHQSFRASLGCDQQPSQFMGISATEWSTRLVTGTTWNKQLWWKVSSSSKENKRRVTVGLQMEQETKTAKSLLAMMESSKTSCMLGNRSMQYVHPPSSLTSLPLQSYELSASPNSMDTTTSEVPTSSMDPFASVDMVLRRTYPQKGRLETWITGNINASSNCLLQFRQVIPPYLTPSWQTLEVLSSCEEATPKIQPFVEWKEDGASVVTFSSTSIPESIVMSLEYGPKFVPYDDIPGDPNRGREMPPAVVQFQCPNNGRFELYSNSPLILPPVPDMSMPFNVLSLSCSLYAYLIGTIVSLLVKRASEKVTYKLHPNKKPKSKLGKLKEKIRSKFNILRGRKTRQETDSNDSGSDESTDDHQDESPLEKNAPNKETEPLNVDE